MCINSAHCRTSCRLELENIKSIFLEVRLGINEQAPGLSQLVPAHTQCAIQERERGKSMALCPIFTWLLPRWNRLGSWEQHLSSLPALCLMLNPLQAPELL